MKKRTAMLIMSMIFLPIKSEAVEFELWKLGKTKKEVIAKAIDKKIQLENDRVIHKSGNGISSNEIEYTREVLNEEADIDLTFTKKTNLLYAVTVLWDNLEDKIKGKKLYELLHSALKEKYTVKDTLESHGFFEDEDNFQKDCDIVTTKYQKNNLSLDRYKCKEDVFVKITYVDNSLKYQNTSEMISSKR